jgi:hypothetical protein
MIRMGSTKRAAPNAWKYTALGFTREAAAAGAEEGLAACTASDRPPGGPGEELG